MADDVSYDPQGRLRLTIRPNAAISQSPPQVTQGDPWAGALSPTKPDEPPQTGDPWAGALSATPPAAKPGSDRVVPTGEAVASGLKEGLSFGLAPAMAGAVEASGVPAAPPTETQTPEEARRTLYTQGNDAGRFFVGAARMLADKFSSHPDPAVADAYNRGREAALQNQQLAQEQHPYAFAGGQLAGALALPIPGLGVAKGAAAIGRVERAFGAGTVAGGLYGAGSAVSEGQDARGIAEGAGQGAIAGGLFGTAGAGVAEAAAMAAKRVGSLFRGAASDESAKTEAARKIADALRQDQAAAARTGRPIGFDPAAAAAGDVAGTPGALVDFGGGKTRALFDAAANLSPEARQAAEEFTQRRFHQQSERVAPYVRNLAGGMGAGDDVEAIKAAARAANKPVYDRAYKLGDRPIMSPKLEQLMSSDAVPQAMAGAVQRGRNRAALDGYGAFNPKVRVTPDGRVVFAKGAQGLPAYPNLQFWDYTQRELKDLASQAARAGRNEEAGAIKGLHRELLNELDKQVPSFGDARGVAARFFGADSAWDAGADFVRRNVDFREFARLRAKMNGPERELFARGFATRLADTIENAGDRNNVLDSAFLNSPAARRKIEMALGPERTDKLEALLRAESVIDQARKTLGGSNTTRRLAQLGRAAGHLGGGAGAVGAYEFLQEGHVEPAHVLAGALVAGAARRGARFVDERVARHVGELLVSNNAQELQRGLAIVTRNPNMMNALRQATAGAARVGAHDIGTRKALAGAAALVQSGLGAEQSSHGHGSDALADQLQ